MPLDGRDVRIMLPRVRRALDPGVEELSAASAYSDDLLTQITADAICELILIGGTAFPYTLSASATDTNGWPTAYVTDPELPLEVQSLVAIQAAIGQLFSELRGLKTKEKIANEGGSWEYEKSATLLRDKLKALLDMRGEALRIALAANVAPVVDRFTNLLEIRSSSVHAEIESYDPGNTS